MREIKLKICGVKSADEARQLADLGIDYIGLNFVPSSGRCITVETARLIMAVLKGSTVKVVALFQNQPLAFVNDCAERLGVNYVQLHGEESVEYVHAVLLPVIYAVRIDSIKAPNEISNFPADYFVLDRKQQGKGKIVDLSLADEIIAANPSRIFLAGGLSPDNLTTVLAKVHPFGIDISSGVRSGKDIDINKVSNCLQIIEKVNTKA